MAARITVLALISCALISLLLVPLSTTSNNYVPTQAQAEAAADVRVHTNQVNSQIAGAVNVNRVHTSEPAPMGITDYGVGSSGPYEYNTSSFLGTVDINSLKTQNSTGDRSLSMQLNVVLQFTSKSGFQYVYWVQDVAIFDSQNNGIYFIDNVWNLSTPSARLDASGISGNGRIYVFQSQSYYADVASGSLPGNGIYLTLPASVEFEANSTTNSQNEAQVRIAYNDGSGWISYDNIVFTGIKDISTNYGFVVNGKMYNPVGTFYDAELILGGTANGWNTTDVQSDVMMQLKYWNGHNYQGIYNAYNFGSNTREGVDNVISQSAFFKTNGSIGAHVSAGSGGLGRLYDRTKISIVSVRSPLISGTFYIKNESSPGVGARYPFVGGDVNVTVAPGTYILSLYDVHGALIAQDTETVSAGEYLPLHVSSASLVTFVMSYSVFGGSPQSAPTLTYSLNGQKITVQLTKTPSVYYLDPGSQWSVTGTIAGKTENERWQTNQTTIGTAISDKTVNLLFYHQFYSSFNYTVVGGGSGFSPPVVEYSEFGEPQSAIASSRVWVDAGTPYSYPMTLSGSDQFERWQYLSGQALNGTASQNSVTIYYSHQYYVTMQLAPSSAGSVSPSSGWYDASGNLVLTETSSSGWGFAGWVGTGVGSYTGNQTVKSITLVGPITESAIYLTSITVSSSKGGSVEYRYNDISGTIQQGTSLNEYVQPGTTIVLTSHPSSPFYSFKQWNQSISGNRLSLNISSPITLAATFEYNYLNISLIAGIPITIVAIALIVVKGRHRSHHETLKIA